MDVLSLSGAALKVVLLKLLLRRDFYFQIHIPFSS